MELKGSQTETNLRRALAGELQARARYLHFAEQARAAGLIPVAELFEATAANEGEHARAELNFLGEIKPVSDYLKEAVLRESEEAAHLYPQAARTAEEEGFTEVARFFQRMGKVEASHEANYRQALEEMNTGQFTGRTVSHSEVRMAQLMLPEQANPAGNVHGGELMKLMDNTAGVVASRHTHQNVVTASVDSLNFNHPVHVGDLALLHGRLTYASRTSIEIRVDVEAESLTTGARVKALTAHFVMVALDASGRPTAVPPLIISTEEETALYEEAEARYKTRKNQSRPAVEKEKK